MNTGAILAAISVVGLSSSPSAAQASPEPEALTFSVNEVGDGRFELIASGRVFSTRDAVEWELLLRAARLSLAEGAVTFGLLAMPGERPNIHPPRQDVSYGSAYGHWQPHWNYYAAGEGWQPWHPEWGARFWAEEIDPERVEQFNAHAMISLEPPERSEHEGPAFNAEAVVRDLTRPVAAVNRSVRH